MQVDTGSFQALQGEVAGQAERIEELKRRVDDLQINALALKVEEMVRREERAPAHLRRERHLRAIPGGQP